MADFVEQAIHNYSGLSSETKPTIAASNNVPNGSRWREVDTAKVYHYNLSDDTWYFADKAIDKSTHATTTIDYAHHEVHSGSHYYIQGHTVLASAAVLRVQLITPNTAKWIHFLYEIKSTLAMTTTFDEGATGGMAGGLRVPVHASNRNTNCYVGMHTAVGTSATIMTDSTAAFVVDALIDSTIYNTTDKSSAIITDNDATTVTVAALLGGTGNEWDTNDKYEINNAGLILTSGVAAATTYDQRIEDDSWGLNDKKLIIGGGGARGDELMLRQNTTYLRTFTSGADDNLIQFRAAWYEHTDRL